VGCCFLLLRKIQDYRREIAILKENKNGEPETKNSSQA